MVICTYFLNNACRFGTKCNNEHVNVKLTLKTDAESTLKGNQWPLSSYGPFRDKPCIPNFIEDQSFEEARHLCYEAKATGNVQMVTNQFTQSVLDAKNKMNMLTNPTDEVVRLVTNLYNSNCTNTPAAAQAQNANPFGMSSNSMNSGASIFGGASNAAPTNNLFGSSSSATSSNPFARNAAGFAAPQNQSTHLFGGSAASSNSMNLFGGGAAGTTTATTGNSLFGGSSFSNTNNASAFGGATQSNSLFGGGSSSGPFSQQTTNASPFALPQSTTQSTGLFGAQAQSNPVFGGGASFGSQVKTGLFGQANAALGATATNTGNIFGQNVQTPAFGAPQQQQQTNLFGNANQNQTQSLFGGQQQPMQSADNPFAAVAQSTTTNIFGQSQMQQQQPQPSPFQSSGSVFGANQNTNAFGGNANMGQSLFSSAAQTNTNQNPLLGNQPMTQAGAPQTLQQQQQSIFGTNSFSAQPNPQTTNPFGGGNVFQNAQQQQPVAQPLFGGQAQQQQQQQQNVFGAAAAAAAAAAQPVQQSKTQYTPMEALSQEEIEAFNSNTFDISKIPTKPPPMELCI